MDTNVLKTFISVCEYSGFSAAAKKLGYTQSTVSSQIRQLERELDTVLFDRFYHKIVLTEDGVTALKYARNILESQKKMIEEIKQPERIEGTIRLAMSSSVCSRYFVDDFLRFREQFPDVCLIVSENVPGNMFDMLQKNEVDLVFTLDSHIYNSEYIICAEREESVHFITAADHPILRQENILLNTLRSEEFVLTESDMSYCKLLNQELCEKVFNLVKDVQIETTEKTRAFMAATFDNADWAIRDPKVLRGTTVTGDNYWKGMHDHENALLMTKTYGCPDPYALTEMEDHAMAVVLDRLGMLDRYIIIRDSVNTDVFMNGASPESLWDPNFVDSLASESSVESADIFATAMKNNFTVGHVVIDAILNGEL